MMQKYYLIHLQQGNSESTYTKILYINKRVIRKEDPISTKLTTPAFAVAFSKED